MLVQHPAHRAPEGSQRNKKKEWESRDLPYQGVSRRGFSHIPGKLIRKHQREKGF